MKKICIVFLINLWLGTSSAFSQTDTNIVRSNRKAIQGMTFPIVNAKTLLGNTIQFPEIAKGKICIVLVAFNDESLSDVESWEKAIPSKYADSSLVFYEIPMIKNAPKLFREVIEKGMRKGTDVKLHNSVANYYGSIKKYQATLQMPDENACYIFVLDTRGQIMYSVEGPANKENLLDLEEIVRTLINSK